MASDIEIAQKAKVEKSQNAISKSSIFLKKVSTAEGGLKGSSRYITGIDVDSVIDSDNEVI